MSKRRFVEKLSTWRKVAAKFGVSVIRDPADAPQITHNLRTVVIDAAGRITKIHSGNDWTPGEVLADLRALVGAAK